MYVVYSGTNRIKTKDYKCDSVLPTKRVSLKRKSSDKDNVSEWSARYAVGLLFQWVSTMQIQLSLILSSTKQTSLSYIKWSLLSSWYSCNLSFGVKQQLHTQVRVNTVFTVFRLLTDFVCLYNYEFWLSLCKIVRSPVILLLPLSTSGIL